MKRTSRDLWVAEAKLRFAEFFTRLEQEHELTYGEIFQMLSVCITRFADDLVEEDKSEEDT